MTVVGATTAELAPTSYVPPFKAVSSSAAAPLVTGTVTGSHASAANPTMSASASAPPVVAGVSDPSYATTYLQSHMMSSPSYRYMYLLWIVLALIAIIYALAYRLRLSGRSFGAVYERWGMRRTSLAMKRKPGAKHRASSSNSTLITIALICVISCVLCVVGSDYIAPSSSVFSFRKRASDSPGYTISKAFWTSGSRFGDMSFALMPLVVLLAMKAPPVAVLSLRALTQLYSDKLAVLHRATAWLVWLLTTVHVVLWSVQLFVDQQNGKPVWTYMWTNFRFIFGCLAYGALTAVMAFSLKPVRKNRYEFFYIAHVVFVFLTIACCAAHHPVLWYWMAAAGALWGAERIVRFIRFARINALFGQKPRQPAFVARPYRDSVPAGQNVYGMQEFKQRPESTDSTVYTDKTLPRPPSSVVSGRHAPGAETPDGEFVERSGLPYYDEGSLQPLGSYDSRHLYDPYARDSVDLRDPAGRSTSGEYFPANAQDFQHSDPSHQRGKESFGTSASIPEALAPPSIPVGFAQAQLLPSHTIRLTIRVPRPFKWAAGQSVLLYLPDLSRIQSHPFTITNYGDDEIVLLVKARKGITRQLFKLVRTRSLATVGITAAKDKRLSLASMRVGEGGVQMPPVFVRAWIDGPMGSSPRVRWGDYSTILIICGGSGVSFGVAICDYVCRTMAQRQKSRDFQTQRIRLCWVVREYAEIAWVASQLRRCQRMVSATQLQIDIFVTRASPVREDFVPPRPGFAGVGHDRRDSFESTTSQMSEEFAMDGQESNENHDASSQYSDVIDLTNYEDEEDVDDPAEHQLSDRLQKQGKMRRAKTRRAARGGGRGVSKSTSYPPQRRQHSALSISESDAEGQYAAVLGSHPDSHPPDTSPYAPSPRPFAHADQSRRASYRSFADSTFAQYDPFAGTQAGFHGISPSPSIMFDETHSMAGESVNNLLSRASRTGSMVLLEDSGSDPTGDAALWIDQSDYAAMNVMSELARPGKPKLGNVLSEEIQQARGSMMVATCGPSTLNTVVRNLVSKHISPGKIRHGDRSGNIAIYSEDYEA